MWLIWTPAAVGPLATLATVPAAAARAENWPEHGFYHVRAVDQHGGPPTCRLRLEQNVDDSLTAVVIGERPSGVLMVQLLAQNPETTSADFLRVGIDRTGDVGQLSGASSRHDAATCSTSLPPHGAARFRFVIAIRLNSRLPIPRSAPPANRS
jgi:hypothetical protein